MRSHKQPAKLAMLLLLVLLLLCVRLGNVHCSTIHEHNVDLHALLDFKQGITNDPRGALSNWSTTAHFCRWNGVICTTKRPFRIAQLNLPGLDLAGQITSSLGNLTFLNTLDLSDNHFVGSLPLLNHLHHLETLYVGNNHLHGIFPDALTNCSNLANLDLSVNLLVGMIPPRIGNLTKLEYLSLYQNNFMGIIPPALGTIATLTQVSLAENQFSGQIPQELWQMPNIVELYLNENSLSGGIPQILPNISSLQELSLAVNMLSGTLPSNIGNALPSLQMLYLGKNTFEGHIPSSLGNASGLERIDLSRNNFSGHIPSFFGKLLNMTMLNIEVNKLEGWEFLDALANCSLLEVLSLYDNQLQGVIPNSVGNLSITLTNLLMGRNKLSGIVPPSIGKLHNLIQLTLVYNNLTGTIEEWVGKLIKLQKLNLRANKFTGTIPSSISHLTQLVFLSLSENDFTGFMASSLGNLQNMLELNFSYNKLQGIIPVEFGNLKQLIALDLSSNKFSGQIPETLGSCEQLLTIRMDQNALIGNVPTTFSNLNTLRLLNLSHNNLSGPLPDSLNGIKLLIELDLSYNSFQGEIPISGVYDNATVVSLDGNSGLCGGTMELHMPPCHVLSRRTRNVNYWVKILIPIFCAMSLLLLVYLLLSVKKTSRRPNLNLQPSFGEHFIKVTSRDLAKATGDFSELNLIGRGSYGSVYRGKLKEIKMEVAIKVFNLEMRGGQRSFMAECEALRSIRHRNLLPIVAACSTGYNIGNVFKALVYEFMPNGNLDMWLHRKDGAEGTRKHLGLIQRVSIAVNVADALDYLHHDCGRPTVHCDLKPSNILLDDDMNALLGDFGIARFYANPETTWEGLTSSSCVKGTIGYIPPEYGGGGHALLTSGDVYSFGIVLLEVLTSKRPTDPTFVDGLDIINFVENNFPDQIYRVIDAHLVEQCKNFAQENMVSENEIYHSLVALLQVALSCTRSLPSERSNMKQVASKIHGIKTSLLECKDKKHSSLRTGRGSHSC